MTASESSDATEPKDAATVVLLRDSARGLEVFLVKRHGKSAFMGGAHVFPGGKLDDADLASALPTTGLDPERAAALLGEPEAPRRARGLFVAGIRETFEEAGVLFAERGARAAATMLDERGARAAATMLDERGARAAATMLDEQPRAASDGARFHDLLVERGLTLRLDALVPHARWITPPIEKRRFDTRFFFARLPEGQAPEHDGRETTASEWLFVRDAIEAQRAGRIVLAPPTLRTLHHLAQFDECEAALDDARSRIPPRIAPELVQEGERFVLALPGDARHSEPLVALPGPTRLYFEDGIFRLP
jgi:8-oxo-dGTP pyrophosphatase MutT (NUDIX family)